MQEDVKAKEEHLGRDLALLKSAEKCLIGSYRSRISNPDKGGISGVG